MGAHGAWHTARLLEVWLPMDERGEWRAARALYPNVKPVTAEVSGQQFLEFHRLMLRHFKWLVANTPNHNHVLQPWSELPAWLKESPENPGGFTDVYLAAWKERVDSLIHDPNSTADQLGHFLESTKLDSSLGSNMHNLCHAEIAAYEYRGPSGYEGAEMDDFATAHYNAHFWNLHGWLDGLYAQWQSHHGQLVDQSPMDPGGIHGPGHVAGVTLDPVDARALVIA